MPQSARPSPNGHAGAAGTRAAALAAAAEVFKVPEAPELVYVTDSGPGIRRLKRGKGFRYVDVEGRPLRDEDELARIRRLAIPPAWKSVWISPFPEGHLQATGRDAKGRKQYRYHPRYREVRDADKFERLVHFGASLPLLRSQADKDLAGKNLSKERVLAAVVLLLDKTLIRVGNEEYVRENEAFGLTTLRDGHAQISPTRLRFVFRSKGGKEHAVTLASPRLARVVKRCQDLPGEELFQYQDDEGYKRTLTSQDVNAYLRQLAGEEFTAKDFRTWGGTVIAARELAAMPPYESRTQAEKNVVQAVDVTAKHLNNTRAVARRSYIHPEVIDSYLEGELPELWPRLLKQTREVDWLSREESALLALLRLRSQSGNGSRRGGQGILGR